MWGEVGFYAFEGVGVEGSQVSFVMFDSFGGRKHWDLSELGNVGAGSYAGTGR